MIPGNNYRKTDLEHRLASGDLRLDDALRDKYNLSRDSGCSHHRAVEESIGVCKATRILYRHVAEGDLSKLYGPEDLKPDRADIIRNVIETFDGWGRQYDEENRGADFAKLQAQAPVKAFNMKHPAVAADAREALANQHLKALFVEQVFPAFYRLLMAKFDAAAATGIDRIEALDGVNVPDDKRQRVCEIIRTLTVEAAEEASHTIEVRLDV